MHYLAYFSNLIIILILGFPKLIFSNNRIEIMNINLKFSFFNSNLLIIAFYYNLILINWLSKTNFVLLFFKSRLLKPFAFVSYLKAFTKLYKWVNLANVKRIFFKTLFSIWWEILTSVSSVWFKNKKLIFCFNLLEYYIIFFAFVFWIIFYYEMHYFTFLRIKIDSQLFQNVYLFIYKRISVGGN